jgi:mRNA export factor
MTTLFGQAATAATNTQGDLSKDVELKQPPSDSVSEIAFSPKNDFLAVSSWDQKIRIYAIDSYGQGEGKALFDFQAPALAVAWSPVRFFVLNLS